MEQKRSSAPKYRILQVVPREPGGVEYHRQVVPHTNLMKLYPEFEVVQIDNIDPVSDELLKDFQLVQFNRIISNFEKKNTALLYRLRRLGIVTVCDLDDYWVLSKDHILRNHFKEHNTTAMTVECIMHSDHVTVTHDLLGQMSELAGKKWSIIPNAIDPSQPQFRVRPDDVLKDTVQFGWVGGACHLEDISLLRESIVQLHSSGLSYNMNLCGFTNSKVYRDYQQIFTAGGTAPQDRYNPVPAMDVFNYANLYDVLDVALVPLNNNLFNRCKSNLKLLEAGFKKKAVICSDIHPYSPLLRHGINGLKVNPTDNPRGWFKMIERYCKNHNMITDHAAQLHEDVQQYHIEKWTHVRAALYKELIEGRNKV